MKPEDSLLSAHFKKQENRRKDTTLGDYYKVVEVVIVVVPFMRHANFYNPCYILYDHPTKGLIRTLLITRV